MTQAPTATLLLTSQCPHCPTVLKGLGELVKRGQLAQLEVINIEQDPEAATRRGVRSVPWTRIGPFELSGLYSPQELAHWVEQASSEEGIATYLEELIKTSQLDKATDFLHASPEHLPVLTRWLGDTDTELNLRIGAGAVIESLAENETFSALIPLLTALTAHSDARVRADAAHYLSLRENPESVAALQALRDDPDPEVREIAAESLESLGITDN